MQRSRLLPVSALSVLPLVFIAAVGCNDDRVYVGDDGALHQIAITEATAAAFESEDGALYIVETRIELPVRAPMSTELADLVAGASNYPDLPFPRLPWIERGDLEIEIDFTLVNLDDEAHDVDVIVNAANEFHEYLPGVVAIDDTPVPLHAQWERRFTVRADERLSYTVREEDMDEAAVDLATVVNGAPNPDRIVYFENKSSRDARSQQYIPEVIPGLIALRLGLRSDAAVPLLLEATVRVRDVSDKLAQSGEPRLMVTPEPFTPMLPDLE